MDDKFENEDRKKKVNEQDEAVRYIPNKDVDRVVSRMLVTHKELLEKLAKDE